MWFCLLLIFWSTSCIANRLLEIRDILKELKDNKDERY